MHVERIDCSNIDDAFLYCPTCIFSKNVNFSSDFGLEMAAKKTRNDYNGHKPYYDQRHLPLEGKHYHETCNNGGDWSYN